MVVRRLALVLTLATSAVLFGQNPPQAAPKLQEKQPEPCTVSGRVVSAADGTPLQSARVGLIGANAEQHREAFGSVTDADGHFEIKKVPPGRYRFVASHAGFISQQYQARGLKGGAMLSLSSGQTVNDAMFRLTRAAVVTGRVVDEAGEPMHRRCCQRPSQAHARRDGGLASSPESGALTSVGQRITDDRGEYRMFGLKPGEYYLKAVESPDEASSFTRAWILQLADYYLVREMASQYAPLYYPGVLQTSEAQPMQLQGRRRDAG